METELKYRVEGIKAYDRYRCCDTWHSWLRQGLRTDKFSADYFDSPDGWLTARHMILRLRREGRISCLTLKWPVTPPVSGEASGDSVFSQSIASQAALSRRGEWNFRLPPRETTAWQTLMAEQPCPSGLDAAIWRQLTALSYQLRASADFHRTHGLLIEGEACFELAVDRGWLRAGAHLRPFCELEFELKSGSLEALLAFGESFAHEENLRAEPKSKYTRLLELENRPRRRLRGKWQTDVPRAGHEASKG